MFDLERDVERALGDMIRSHGGRCLKFVSPERAGVPDRIILLPKGRVLFVETKRPKGGTPSALQKYWHRELHRLGFDAYFINTKEAVTGLELTLFGGGDDEV